MNRALTAMTEKFEEATKAAEESERFDMISVLVNHDQNCSVYFKAQALLINVIILLFFLITMPV